MATLTGQSIKDSYKSILKTESTVGFNGSIPTRIEDGDGNGSSLSLGKSKANITGSLSLNLSSVSTPRANLHVVGTATQSMLIQSTNGYNKFYVGDFLGGYNVKMGDIDSSSAGNNTYFCVQDSDNRITSKTTYFGINQTVPTATLHVGSNSGKALFSLGASTDAFKITSSSNDTLFSVDTTNDKIFINSSIVMTGKSSISGSTQRIQLEEYFAQIPRPFLYATETKDWGSIDDGNELVEEITVTGAALGDFARASFSLDVADLELSAQVTAANTVTVSLSNNTGGAIDLGEGIITVYVTEKDNIENKNLNLMITGTNADGVGSDVGWSVAAGGIHMNTDGADNDQVILFPRGAAEADPINSSMWASTTWQSDSEVHWECAIATGASIDHKAIFAGLKLTAVGTYATDADQAYFLYSSDDDMGALTTNADLHFVYSVGGTDYITDLKLDGVPIVILADQKYRLKIEVDSNRQVSAFVNEVQYGLVTSATAGGGTQSVATTKSLALTTNIGLKATIGVQALTGSAKGLGIFYERISRMIG